MTKIYVYTGTGNSYASAQQLAAELGEELGHNLNGESEFPTSDITITHITHELGESRPHIECERCIIIFPVYAYAPPKTVRRFLQSATFNVDYMVVIGTIGSATGGALAECVRLLKKRGQKTHLTAKIKCVENFVHMFKLPEEERIPIICQKQREITKSIAHDIKEQKTNKRLLCRPDSSTISVVFKTAAPQFAKRYKITSKCNGCGICYRVCPALAIEMDETTKRPKFVQKQCDHCQACMQLCPKKAIHFGKVTPDGRRYCHPDVSMKEMFKR